MFIFSIRAYSKLNKNTHPLCSLSYANKVNSLLEKIGQVFYNTCTLVFSYDAVIRRRKNRSSDIFLYKRWIFEIPFRRFSTILHLPDGLKIKRYIKRHQTPLLSVCEGEWVGATWTEREEPKSHQMDKSTKILRTIIIFAEILSLHYFPEGRYKRQFFKVKKNELHFELYSHCHRQTQLVREERKYHWEVLTPNPKCLWIWMHCIPKMKIGNRLQMCSALLIHFKLGIIETIRL